MFCRYLENWSQDELHVALRQGYTNVRVIHASAASGDFCAPVSLWDSGHRVLRPRFMLSKATTRYFSEKIFSIRK